MGQRPKLSDGVESRWRERPLAGIARRLHPSWTVLRTQLGLEVGTVAKGVLVIGVILHCRCDWWDPFMIVCCTFEDFNPFRCTQGV